MSLVAVSANINASSVSNTCGFGNKVLVSIRSLFFSAFVKAMRISSGTVASSNTRAASSISSSA